MKPGFSVWEPGPEVRPARWKRASEPDCLLPKPDAHLAFRDFCPVKTSIPTMQRLLSLHATLTAAAAVFVSVCATGFSSTNARAQGQPSAVAAFAVMDAASGHILSASNPAKKLQVGSLTKIATAAVVLDWLELTKRDVAELVTVPPEVNEIETMNPVGILPGDQLSVRDLLYAAMLQSDNIAAHTLAHYVGRNLEGASPKAMPVDRFVAQMNALGRRLGMANTLFLNPHGLDASERKPPYSTAADIARLTRYALGKSSFQFYVAQKERQITVLRSSGEQTQYLLQNTNELLGVNDIDGVKTGKTRRAGECLVVSAARAPESIQEGDKFYITPRRLIVVVLGARARFEAASQLLHSGWQRHEAWVAEGRPTPSPIASSRRESRFSAD